jgi:hypothetical protein
VQDEPETTKEDRRTDPTELGVGVTGENEVRVPIRRRGGQGPGIGGGLQLAPVEDGAEERGVYGGKKTHQGEG